MLVILTSLIIHEDRRREVAATVLVHSRYERKLADPPWNGVPVQVILHTRRFFCSTAGCSQRVFTSVCLIRSLLMPSGQSG